MLKFYREKQEQDQTWRLTLYLSILTQFPHDTSRNLYLLYPSVPESQRVYFVNLKGAYGQKYCKSYLISKNNCNLSYLSRPCLLNQKRKKQFLFLLKIHQNFYLKNICLVL
jgi:hypothetical protein